jgi:hypothetical protein
MNITVCITSLFSFEDYLTKNLKHLGWEDDIEMDLTEVWVGGVDLTDPDQDRDRWLAVVNAVINLRIPKNAGKFLSS